MSTTGNRPQGPNQGRNISEDLKSALHDLGAGREQPSTQQRSTSSIKVDDVIGVIRNDFAKDFAQVQATVGTLLGPLALKVSEKAKEAKDIISVNAAPFDKEDDRYVLFCEFPGVNPADIQVSVDPVETHPDLVKVTASATLYRGKERSYSLNLPVEQVDVQGTTTEYANGLLKIYVPIAQKPTSFTVPVNG